MKTVCSQGKVLLMGEYSVLFGGEGLSFSTNYQQKLSCSISKEKGFSWESSFLGKGFEDKTSEDFIARTLSCLEKEFELPPHYQFKSEFDFLTQWGFGSSATTISNLSKLFDLDPLKLNSMLSAGSGYDVLTSYLGESILYTKKKGVIEKKVKLSDALSPYLTIVYSNQKLATEKHLKEISQIKFNDRELEVCNNYVRTIMRSSTVDEFKEIINSWNALLEARGLINPWKDLGLGTIKPLGAWGGDCFLLVSQEPRSEISKKIKKLGFETFWSWEELVKQ